MINRFYLSAVAMVLAVTISVARGQQAVPAIGETPGQLLADQLLLVAQERLSGEGDIQDDQITRARILLDLALGLTPDDAETWRLRAELAGLAQDEPGYQDALRQYLRLRPDDDTAQFSLITSRFASYQTIDQRVQAAERMLEAEAAKNLSASLRSRLASYAAGGAQEMGDQARFAHWLKVAAKLDPANPTAAALMYQLATGKQGVDPVVVGATLINLVKATPADPMARLDLAERLLSQTEFELAAKQFKMAFQLTAQPLSSEALIHWITSDALAGQAAAALDVLRQVEMMFASAPPTAATQPADSATPNGPSSVGATADTSAAPTHTPAKGILPLPLQLWRVAILTASEQHGAATTALQLLNEQLTQQFTGGNLEAGITRAWITCLFNGQADAAEQYLQAVPADNAVIHRCRGWLALHRGETELARAELTTAVENGQDHVAMYGLALLEQAGSKAQIEGLKKTVEVNPRGIAAMLATAKLRQLGQPMQPTSAGLALRAIIERSPSRLWDSDLSWAPWVEMRCEVEPARIGYLEPLSAQITVRNVSGAPLAVGHAGGLAGTVLVALMPSVGGQPVGSIRPIVVDINRQLTLQPQERVAIRVRLDRSMMGSVLASNPFRTITLDAMCVLNPTTNATGGLVAGTVGAVQSVRALQVIGQPLTRENVDLWLSELRSNDRATQMRAVARLLNLMASVAADNDPQGLRQEVAQAISQQYGGFDAVGQAWTMRFLSGDMANHELLRRVVDQAQRSTDPAVRIMHLVSRVAGPSDAVLLAAMREENPLIHEFAQAMTTSLERSAASAAAAGQAQSQ